MTRHLKAIYEDGVFRPLEPVEIAEHQEVSLLVETPDEARPMRTRTCPSGSMPRN